MLSEAQASTTIELIAITDAIDRAVDAKDWARARALFADKLDADFLSLSGQPAARIPADALIEAWSNNLKAAKLSFHMRSNHQVTTDGDRASVTSAGYALNCMEGNGDPLWEVWGNYRHGFIYTADGWKCDAMTFEVVHQRGNLWVRDTIPA